MKKKVSIVIIIAMLAMVLLTSCSNQKGASSEVSYYNPIPYVREVVDNTDYNFYVHFEGRELNATEKQTFNQIYKKLAISYNSQKEMPLVQIVTQKELLDAYGNSSIIPRGVYVSELKTLFVVEGAFENAIAVIAHEIMHYLSDNSSLQSLCYEKDNLMYGLHFSEGVTNLLSTKYFPFSMDSSVYEFETQVAKLFSIAYGEEELAQGYLSSNFEALKNDFNNALEGIYFEKEVKLEFLDPHVTVNMSPYDLMVSCVDSYFLFLSCVESPDDEFTEFAMSQVDTITEMLLHYGEVKGVREEMEKSLSDFITNEYLISWSHYSNIGEMIGLI